MMVWLFSPCYISVVNNLYFDYLYCCTHLQLYNCPLPGESLVLYLSVQPLYFLEVTLSPEEMWHLAHVPCFARAVGKTVKKIIHIPTTHALV